MTHAHICIPLPPSGLVAISLKFSIYVELRLPELGLDVKLGMPSQDIFDRNVSYNLIHQTRPQRVAVQFLDSGTEANLSKKFLTSSQLYKCR